MPSVGEAIREGWPVDQFWATTQRLENTILEGKGRPLSSAISLLLAHLLCLPRRPPSLGKGEPATNRSLPLLLPSRLLCGY